jgi:phosphoribosylaminoimidazolecarboxamide formyltransferase/IMP cyclohydrolase
MNTTKTIQSALISVFSKEGLEPIVRKLHSQNVVLYSTGNRRFYKKLGIPVTAVEDVTSYPSILAGVDITPKSFGGILNRQDNESDVQQMKDLTFHKSI